MQARDVEERLDRIERTLRQVQAEVDEIRASVTASVSVPEVPPVPAPVVPQPAPVATPTIAAAWRALERGRDREAVEQAQGALARALAAGDAAEVRAVEAFADAAAMHVTDPELAVRLAALARHARPAPTAPTAAPTPRAIARPVVRPIPASAEAETPSRPPAPVRPNTSARVSAWARRELTGSRLFALVGGILMLLGVVFLFVVAANRGWVGPGERVLLGAIASLGVLLAGLVLRFRYGRLQSSLAAVGAGVAGAYATLAAATILYGFVPAWGALLLAAAIASVGGAIGIVWSSQLLTGLALVGAAAAPGLVALDEGVEPAGPTFALVVLAVGIAVAASRRWLWLVVAVGAAALPQVVWLVADSPAEDGPAIAVAAAASLLLLAGAVAWQAGSSDEGADGAAATMALLGAGLTLGAVRALLPDATEAGAALAVAAVVYGGAAVAAGRRFRDLGWVIGGAALVLAGVATADLLSGRSLSITLAVQAVVLAGLAWRLRSPRFELSALVYLALGVAHTASVELEGAADLGDVPRAAVPALFALGAAALLVGLLLPRRRADGPSVGFAAALEPLWDGLGRARVWIRATLSATALVLVGVGSAGLLDGRWLTIAWAAASAGLGLAAFATGERRLLALALPTLAAAVAHAWSVEAPLSTLALERDLDPLTPIPSVLALAAASVALAFTSCFDQRGIRLLGPLEGPELALTGLDARGGALLREGLLQLSAGFAVWAAGLAAIDVSFDWGQVVATVLWAALGVGLVVGGAAARPGMQVTGWGAIGFAFLKSVLFDWGTLGSTPAATSLLVVSAAVLAAGFASRWRDAEEGNGLEVLSIASAILATGAAIAALERLAGDDEIAFGVSLLGLAAVLSGLAVPPFLRWRARGVPNWARTVATAYWVLALGVVLFAEAVLADFDATPTLVLWAATATLLALAWRPVGEPGLWVAGLAVAAGSTAAVVAIVTPLDRLVVASAHPGEGLVALLLCVAAAVALAWLVPPFVGESRPWLVGASALLGLYAFSLIVLELAERVSGASVETDFQRGHTALSTLLGLGALGIYVVGLARDVRALRLAGLTLFGLALAKLFLYDLSSLSSITRALSFIALGAVLLAAAFFAERAVGGEPDEPAGRAGPRTAG